MLNFILFDSATAGKGINFKLGINIKPITMEIRLKSKGGLDDWSPQSGKIF